MNDQIAVKNQLRKRLWKQLVQAKIRAQADNLAPDSPARKKLLAYAVDVRSGDTTNREAHAARVYWQNWMIHPDAEVSEDHFRRTRDGAPPNPPTCALRSTSCNEAGKSLQAIADELNNQGHTTRRSKPWNRMQVSRVLKRAG